MGLVLRSLTESLSTSVTDCITMLEDPPNPSFLSVLKFLISHLLSDIVVNPHSPARIQLRHTGRQRLKKLGVPEQGEENFP